MCKTTAWGQLQHMRGHESVSALLPRFTVEQDTSHAVVLRLILNRFSVLGACRFTCSNERGIRHLSCCSSPADSEQVLSFRNMPISHARTNVIISVRLFFCKPALSTTHHETPAVLQHGCLRRSASKIVRRSLLRIPLFRLVPVRYAVRPIRKSTRRRTSHFPPTSLSLSLFFFQFISVCVFMVRNTDYR